MTGFTSYALWHSTKTLLVADRSLCLLRDRNAIEAWLRRDPSVHLYELGDLDDFFWPHTTWYGLVEGGDLSAIALLYSGTSLPVLVLMGREADLPAARALLELLAPVLPTRFYAHLVPGSADVLARFFDLAPHGPHDRMVLVDRTNVNAIDIREAVALGKGDEVELVAFFANAYPGNWFDPRMLETGAYFAVRRGGALLSVAGVHVVSRVHRVAALGNIATAPAARGQGLARIAIAAVCRALAGVEPLGLNVATENATAIALYRRLGFDRVTSYEEYMVTTVSRRERSPSGAEQSHPG